MNRAERRDATFAAVMLVAAIAVIAALAFLCSIAHADPAAAGPAPVLLVLDVPLPDGGAEDLPAPMHKGQSAPADGVFLTTAEASKRAGARAGDRLRISLLEHEIAKADATTPALLGTLAGGITTALLIWCTSGHDCNPLHIGRK